MADKADSVGVDTTEARQELQGEVAEELIDKSINGIALHEIITDEAGEPVDYRFLDVNSGFEEHTGLSAQTVIGKRATEVLPEIEETPFIDIYGRVALQDETVRFTEYSKPLERYFDVAAFSPREGLFVTTFFDITERKKQKQQLIEKAERLDAFAGRLAHEFRNSLSVMMAQLDLAANSGEIEHFESLERSFNRMDRLVDDLVLLARDDEITLSSAPVDLACIADTCWDVIRAPDATLQLSTDAYIMADEDRLRQLLENLYWHILEHGGENVTVTVGDLDGGFCVKDESTELPAEERAALFEEETTALEHGTGLGLAIVQQTAASHGWSLSVVEADDGGIRIEFRNVEFLDTDDPGTELDE